MGPEVPDVDRRSVVNIHSSYTDVILLFRLIYVRNVAWEE